MKIILILLCVWFVPGIVATLRSLFAGYGLGSFAWLPGGPISLLIQLFASL